MAHCSLNLHAALAARPLHVALPILHGSLLRRGQAPGPTGDPPCTRSDRQGTAQAVPPGHVAQRMQTALGSGEGRHCSSRVQDEQTNPWVQAPALPVVVPQTPLAPMLVVQMTGLVPPQGAECWPARQPRPSWVTQRLRSFFPFFGFWPRHIPEQQTPSLPRQARPTATQPNSLRSSFRFRFAARDVEAVPSRRLTSMARREMP